MKTKILLGSVLAVAAIAAAAVLWAQNMETKTPEPLDEVKEWERMAEKGDTAALHKLLRFYDDNAMQFVEVEGIIDCDGNELSPEEVAAVNEENRQLAEESAQFTERLDYWLSKGLAVNDPVATYIKGMRLFYTDKTQALKYLSQSAESGNSQAALFCGSEYFNEGQLDNAIKNLTIAYDAGVPSAGWHLAMCYAQKGNDKDIEQAIEYLRHSAELDFPEAVLEMRRIEPTNPVWQHKVDSLDISFPDYPIIPTE